MKKSFSQFTVLVTLLVMVSCATTGPGGEKSLILIPTSYEVQIGEGMAQQVAETETKLPDQQWQDYLNEVGQKLVAVSDRNDIEYHFTVIESDQINAFAAPGGYVYFYTGLLKLMDNEAEMAAVMAHEISHVVARHGIKRLQTAMGAQLAYQLVFGKDNNSEALNAAISVGLGLAFAGYSRDAEREADRYGIIYMQKAGYDPHAAESMFQKLMSAGEAGSGSVFEKLASSHPESQERIDNAQVQIAEMSPLPANLRTGKDRYQTMVQRLPSK
jgi:predicted Zn-dependent protease